MSIHSLSTLRLSGLDFEAFGGLRLRLLRDFPSVLDAANTSLYRTLPGISPHRFAPIPPSVEDRAAYRCHLAEAMLEHLGFEVADWRSQALVSQGVRSSLALLWSQPDVRSRKMWLPTDVYPVYQALATEAGVDLKGYEARLGLPWDALAHTRQWCVLVCDPLKPWGASAPAQDLDKLVGLAKAQDGLVLVDGAYAPDPSPKLRALLRNRAPLAWLWSLSKGWLIPYRAGLVLTSPSLANAWRPAFSQSQKSERALREAYAALSEFPSRPAHVRALVDSSRERLFDRLADNARQVRDPGHGYFLASDLTPEQWWERGVLAIPSSVFGSAHPGSVLSSLGALGFASQGDPAQG